MTKIRTFFPTIIAISSNFQESAGETSSSPPSSYALVEIRKYKIPLFTRFSVVKLKIDLFSVSMIFLKKYFVLDPVDIGRKLNVNKTFRRRDGRLLNALCTFNFRPVFTGEAACCLFLFT